MFALSRSVFTLLVGLVMAAGSVYAQNSGPAQRVRNIGIIDFYGLHKLTAGQLRSQLTFDPYDDVRNNAMRALLVFSAATKVKAPHVPYGPFIAMLDSPVWTDRNKSSGALMQMAKARDPALLRVLRRQAMPSLVEMARWNDQDHSFAALSILGDIAGVDDKDILRAWTGHEGERIISAALAQ